MSTAVSFAGAGEPTSVLKVGAASSAAPGAGEVAVKMVAAPISMDDLASVTSKGKGGISSKKGKVRFASVNNFTFSAAGGSAGVGGNAGVGVVTDVGSGVSDLSSGDMVVPVVSGLGTWASTLVAPASSLAKVPASTVPEAAATLADKTAAYCLLHDFANLSPGDIIIQDGAEGAVGTAVVQLASKMGIKTISVVSDSIYYADTADRLKGMGGDIVVTSSYLHSAGFYNLVSDLPAPKLALSCSGGDIASKVARSLSSGASLVVYGAKSEGSIQVPSEIADGVSVEGFWLNNKSAAERAEIASKVLGLNVWVETYPFSDYETALQTAVDGFGNRTVVVKME
jgi:trans-2-enoyl-CoA reductase